MEGEPCDLIGCNKVVVWPYIGANNGANLDQILAMAGTTPNVKRKIQEGVLSFSGTICLKSPTFLAWLPEAKNTNLTWGG